MRSRAALAATAAILLFSAAGPASAAALDDEAAPQPSQGAAAEPADPFYTYDGEKPLSSYRPGDVLKTRTSKYHVAGIPTPVQAVQLLYRTVGAQGRPVANVTSVLRSSKSDGSKAVSYQSFYDALDARNGPSRAIAGDVSLGALLPQVESAFMAPLLLKGYDVVVPDTEGPNADLLAGEEYAYTTLDSLRAVSLSGATGLDDKTRIGLAGYSGGAIATNWAAALAPRYAPEINDRLVGFTEGGPLVNLDHALQYIDGSVFWSGVMPLGVIGIGRAYDVEVRPYLNSYGKKVYDKLQHASITDALGRYPGLTVAKLTEPEYKDPHSIPGLTAAMNKANLGSAPTPTVPGFIAQGNGGVVEGTFSNKPGIGRGDGVMPSGDTRALARQYCATGNTSIQYKQYALLGHVGASVPWMATSLGWLEDRFAGEKAPSSCGSIPAGNSLAPAVPTKPAA